MLFERRMHSLLTSKNALSSCRWKHRQVLFLLVQRVFLVMIRYVARKTFFFFSSYLSFLKNYSLTLLVVGISTSVLILLISHFWS
jgi:hypothetical protein